MPAAIMPNTTAESSGIAATKIIAAFQSMKKAMTIAPNTIKGERRNSRSTRLTPDCSWLMSLVMRVMSVDWPISSSSL